MLQILGDGPVKRCSEIRKKPLEGSSVKDEVRKGSRDIDVAGHGAEREALFLLKVTTRADIRNEYRVDAH